MLGKGYGDYYRKKNYNKGHNTVRKSASSVDDKEYMYLKGEK